MSIKTEMHDNIPVFGMRHYSYTGKDTSILSIVCILMKNSNASKLPCDILYLLGSDFEVH